MEVRGLVHKERGLRLYVQQSTGALSHENLMAVLAQPGMSDFFVQPQRTFESAPYLHSAGIQKEQGSWKDYLLPVARDLDGS